jgi:hypothetical protein
LKRTLAGEQTLYTYMDEPPAPLRADLVAGQTTTDLFPKLADYFVNPALQSEGIFLLKLKTQLLNGPASYNLGTPTVTSLTTTTATVAFCTSDTGTTTASGQPGPLTLDGGTGGARGTSNLVMVAGSAALLLVVLPGHGPLLAVVAGLLGLGVAASVSPALFMAGFSLKSRLLQRVFAMIELMRAVTAFLVAPILVFLAEVIGPNRSAGTEDAVGVCLAIALVGFLGGSALYLSGRPRLETPDLDRWQGGDEPAWSSPPLGDAIRHSSSDPHTSVP